MSCDCVVSGPMRPPPRVVPAPSESALAQRQSRERPLSCLPKLSSSFPRRNLISQYHCRPDITISFPA
jgi:hypothetical protein